MSLVTLLAAAPVAAGEDIRDIRGPIALPTATSPWPYVIAAAVALVIALAVVAVIRHRRRRIVPADVAALRALEAARGAITHGDPRTFSSEVSAAVRGYVELAFGVHAPRLTTEELLADLMTEDSPVAGHRQELGAFLEHCDLAKYARWALSKDQMTAMLDSATSFVRATAGGAS